MTKNIIITLTKFKYRKTHADKPEHDNDDNNYPDYHHSEINNTENRCVFYFCVLTTMFFVIFLYN